MEKKIINIIKEKGPITGSELVEVVSGDGLILWQACKTSKALAVKTFGTRYLRLDRRVKGLARLSPSILREFLTYSVIGLSEDPSAIEQKARAARTHIEKISRSKLDLAYSIASSIASEIDSELSSGRQVCFIIAGDIVYNMAHDVPRPERSTKRMVNGSDMDIVVILDDMCSESMIRRLDEAIYREKCKLLITPHIKEELDYIVKKMKKVRTQVRFDSFRHMVACKILQEGTLLYGSEKLFRAVKTLLREEGVLEKLMELERKARIFRENAEKYLSTEDPEKTRKENLPLFYPTEESEEFE